ncbi:glycoside hydrolase family 9 protein [Nocardiopsis ansamitocini]|uniref:Endoglucanase n=1 Tax=Nocardiopsis ansamitocini TaxID=1670832 RepID=A0A9W6P7G9_9ACTN|nr:glycoside hydrolase family 9 protein [Nocardiopsis ansamitocini]GLU48585.1 endoglucanase [Nocardiopsis ansamitocini]
MFREPGRRAPRTLTATALACSAVLAGAALVAAPAHADVGPIVKVNQVGYFPDGPKNATVTTDAASPLAWELSTSSGTVVAEGTTTPRGYDPSTDTRVHSVDFSDYTEPGSGYRLTVDGAASHPFDLDTGAYDALRVDALSFYYPQRSGIEILDSVAPGYGRAAGHVGVAPNQGDISVPCAPGTCNYSLDVSGGWYDAGDHGKYVVNGGISVHQVMSAFERTGVADVQEGALGDSTLRVPEHGNGVPDVLDEARWQMEFMLKMQVPAGQPRAGMAHHKIHDENWTGLPLMPAADPQRRYLQPPSTAATLNLAATAAQCARVFEPYDSGFAAECLDAAETAWTAAKANPAVYAPAEGQGGGPYNDNDVTDEFYWAAAELFITTGAQQYRTEVTASPLHTENVFRDFGFEWASTAPLARLQLATLPNGLADRDRVRASVVTAADRVVELVDDSPWGLAYATEDGAFYWGSNNLVINNLIIAATAYDLTGDDVYRDTVLQGMDYIFGRNALGQSYVTGYGENDARNQHSRWYAHQLDPSLPNPPDGTLAGGPNSQSWTWDELAHQELTGCAPQTCYLDDIHSWSTNELTINWNAPLSWIASFIADQGQGGDDPGSGDTTAPTVPGAPVASGITGQGAVLTWDASTDSGGSGLAGYDVYRVTGSGTELVGSPTAASLTLTGLTPDTGYTHRVVARDRAGNRSAAGADGTFRTVAGGGDSACRVAYTANTWQGGFTGSVRLTNTGDTPRSGWQLTFAFAAGQTLTNGWNAQWSQSGNTVTATSLAWNNTLAPGASVDLGFNGAWSGSNPAPTGFTLNGATCAVA